YDIWRCVFQSFRSDHLVPGAWQELALFVGIDVNNLGNLVGEPGGRQERHALRSATPDRHTPAGAGATAQEINPMGADLSGRGGKRGGLGPFAGGGRPPGAGGAAPGGAGRTG